MSTRPLRVLVVRNRYRSERPSGVDRVVDQEIHLLTEIGHDVTRFERHSDDIAAMSLLGRASVPLQVPWNPAVWAGLMARLQAERPDIVHIYNTFPLLIPSGLAASAAVGIPVMATLHNYLQVCPTGTPAWDLIAASGGIGVPLVLAGTGPLGHDMSRWTRGRDDVRYLGLRSKAECVELTARSAAVVAPSAWREPLGLVVVEAIATAVPTVAAAHGVFVELVQDQVTGMLHRPGDAASLADCLRRAVVDVDKSLALGDAARRCYESGFTPAAGLAAPAAGYETAIIGSGTCEPL